MGDFKKVETLVDLDKLCKSGPKVDDDSYNHLFSSLKNVDVLTTLACWLSDLNTLIANTAPGLSIKTRGTLHIKGYAAEAPSIDFILKSDSTKGYLEFIIVSDRDDDLHWGVKGQFGNEIEGLHDMVFNYFSLNLSKYSAKVPPNIYRLVNKGIIKIE